MPTWAGKTAGSRGERREGERQRGPEPMAETSLWQTLSQTRRPNKRSAISRPSPVRASKPRPHCIGW